MHRQNGTTFYSASDLADFVECRHIATLGLKNLVTPLPKKAAGEEATILQAHGIDHETDYLNRLRSRGLEIADIPTTGTHDERVQQTLNAMRNGADVIYQAAFELGSFRGYADFLLKVAIPSNLGNYSYEVADTKLARKGKARHLVQIVLYSDMLEASQGLAPAYAHLELGDGTEKSYRLDDFRHYVAALKQRFLAFMVNPPETQPEKCSHCGLCPWEDLCKAEWVRQDHLNQVANVRAGDIRKLHAAGISTLKALAMAAEDVKEIASFATIKTQAALQLKKRDTGIDAVVCKTPDPETQNGFFQLPIPDEGDLYFDMEGYPHDPGGLEYLFGVCYREGSRLAFKPFWGHTRQEEKLAFEQFIDFVMERIALNPRLHIYHYADYERRALKKLMAVHGTREAEVDQLLRDQRLVDLYAVVRHAIQTSEPRYSIKNLETFYMKGERASDVKNAGASIVYYEHWRTQGDQKWLEDIERYNEEDCVSTEKLHVWLLQLRERAQQEYALAIPWMETAVPDIENQAEATERSAKALAAEALRNTLRERLTSLLASLPTDSPQRGAAELNLHLLDFYWREAKPAFWKMFEQQKRSVEELIDDLDVIAGLTLDPTAEVVKDKQSFIYHYRMPPQEYRLKMGDGVRDTQSLGGVGTIAAIDPANQRIALRIGGLTLKRVWDEQMPGLLSISASGRVDMGILQSAIMRYTAARYADDAAPDRYRALASLLERQLPRISDLPSGAPVLSGNASTEAVIDVVQRLQESYLIVQGPPGTGKTYTGARVILSLLEAGKRVGVCAMSHKAVSNLLNAVTDAAIKNKKSFVGARKGDKDAALIDDRFIKDVDKPEDTLDPALRLVGGTAWVFAREDADQTYDYLFVDEAGQVSLANLVAMGCAARNIVLLGDQMQLGQPLQGTHPGDSGLSALQYLLRDHATVPQALGVLLNVSYRMHPDVCGFISDAVYDSRLTNHPDTANQQLVLNEKADRVLKSSGIAFEPVTHTGCAQTSTEEAVRIREIIASLCSQSFIDTDQVKHPIKAENILVVAPYNAQVRVLKELLPETIAIGTVDKFQGQEAEVVIISMTTSSGEEMPRNMEFLFDPHRLNVAISRAKILAILVASPKLLEIDCTTPEQMALVNTLCWVADLGNSGTTLSAASSVSYPDSLPWQSSTVSAECHSPCR